MIFNGLLTLQVAACADRLATLGEGPPSLGVARAALDGGVPDVALRISIATRGREPDNVDAMVVEGDALAALDKPREADAAFRAALALKPDDVDARLGLGRLALASNPAAAEAIFLEILGRDPRNAKALNNLGVARDLQGRHAEAQEAYQHALGLAPTMQAAVANLNRSRAMSTGAQGGPGR